MRIRLVMLGKTRRAEIRALLDDYVRRIGHYCAIETHELREPFAAALRKLKTDPAATWVLLDASGRQLTSQQFAHWLGGLRDGGTRELVFLCGDAGGFPAAIARSAQVKLALSTLTMPHELTRVLLAEQLYRAFTILHGHPYPK